MGILNLIRGAENIPSNITDEDFEHYNEKEKSKLQKIRNKIVDVIIYTVIAILVLPLVPLLLPVFLAAIFNLKAIKKFVEIFMLTNERRNDLIDAYLTLGFSTFEDTQTKKSSDGATVDIKSIIDTNYKALAVEMHPDKKPDEKEKYTEIFKKIWKSKKIIEDNAGKLKIEFTKEQFDKRKKEFDSLPENKNELDGSLNIFESTIKKKEVKANQQKKFEGLDNGLLARGKRFVLSIVSRLPGDKNSQKKDSQEKDSQEKDGDTKDKNLVVQTTSVAKSRIDSLNDVKNLINTSKIGQDIILPESNAFRAILRKMKEDNPNDMELQKFSVDQAGDNNVIYYNEGKLNLTQKTSLLKKIEEKIQKEFSTNPSRNMDIDTKSNLTQVEV